MSKEHNPNEDVMSGQASEALERMALGREISHRFTYHRPEGMKKQIHGAIRDDGKEFAVRIAAVTPICYEQAEALKAIELAVFWANAAIARRT